MMTVAVVLALAVVGTGGAFAYRTFVGSPRSGEPPIIKADNSPTKVVPAPGGRLAPRCRTAWRPATARKRSFRARKRRSTSMRRTGPRVVFPPLNPNSNPPSAASVAPAGPPPAGAGNGTLPNNEPRKIKTLAVRGDQADGGGGAGQRRRRRQNRLRLPHGCGSGAGPGRAATRSPPSSANASANAPLSLTPQAGATGPAEPRDPGRRHQSGPGRASAGGGYLVQVSSQKNEADAQASYRALQGKYPAVLGSRSPVIKRADLGDKGVYYRAMVGPFGSADEATQFCGNLKTAGGQCVVQRN